MGTYLPRAGLSLLWVLMVAETSLATCPPTLEVLVDKMLPDLPAYTNRVIQRSRRIESLPRGYVLLAGKPSFDPLPLSQRQFTPAQTDTTEQAFFTTLERHYNSSQATLQQNFYWAFFTPTSQGWQLSLLFSQLAAPYPGTGATPPRSAENGAVGQAIKLWLRDCRAEGLKKPVNQGINKAKQ